MSKGSSTTKWLHEPTSDYYVIQATKLGYRSRASFNILEIQDKYLLFKPNLFVVDLGASPG
ncbi:SAM-dependent methyltransferase, partial [Francisella tularensis]|uniref:SAM-dependent methyltransferase n=1 Tax=Francisella tularensis TaxID=263 RepID=UPI002381BB01